MKRFHFRLESVLRVRRFEFDRTRAQLARLEEERARRESTFRDEVDRLARGAISSSTPSARGPTGKTSLFATTPLRGVATGSRRRRARSRSCWSRSPKSAGDFITPGPGFGASNV